MVNATVIIPCKDMADTLTAAVESALAAKAANVIIVNDGSKDNTDIIARDLERVYESVVYIRSSMSNGVCFARNQAIAHPACTGLVIPLDADDTLLLEGVTLLADAWEHNTWVYGGWIETDGDASFPVDAPPPGMLDRKNVCHATMLFSRADWERVGGYDPDFNIGGEDWAFQRALTTAGVKPVRIDAPIYTRWMKENHRTDKARERIPFINKLMVEKYG